MGASVSNGWTARLTEELAADDRGPVATGMYRVDLEPEDTRDEPAGESLGPMAFKEALTLARTRARRVLVHESGFGGATYTAGTEPVDGAEPLSGQLATHRRRLRGWEFVDRTEADPVSFWDVIVEATFHRDGTLGGKDLLSSQRGWASALAEDPRCELVEWRPAVIPAVPAGAEAIVLRRVGHFPIAVIRLRARTVREATELAVTAAEAAVEGYGARFRASQAYPAGTEAGRRNAHLPPVGVPDSAQTSE